MSAGKPDDQFDLYIFFQDVDPPDDGLEARHEMGQRFFAGDRGDVQVQAGGVVLAAVEFDLRPQAFAADEVGYFQEIVFDQFFAQVLLRGAIHSCRVGTS